MSECSYGAVTHYAIQGGDLPSIQFLGDSEIYVATAALRAEFGSTYRVGIDAVSGFTTHLALGGAASDAASDPDVVVTDFGGNDADVANFDPATIEAEMTALYDLFPNSCFIWVDGVTTGDPTWHPDQDDVLDQFKSATFPHTLDWGAAKQPGYFTLDGDPHTNAAGSAALAALIHTAVTTDCAATTTTDPATTDTTDTTVTDPTDPVATDTTDPGTTDTTDTAVTDTTDPTVTDPDPPPTDPTDPSATDPGDDPPA